MNKIRKSNTAKILVAVMVLMVAGSGTAFAATSGTLTLTGTVPSILEISVNAAGNTDLDLGIDASNVKVATVVERSNKKSGYTVTLESENAVTQNADKGVFSNDDPDVSASLDYTISYGGEQVSLTDGSAIISNVSEKTAGSGASNEVAISYNGATDFPYEGNYSDTLTFTIAAK